MVSPDLDHQLTEKNGGSRIYGVYQMKYRSGHHKDSLSIPENHSFSQGSCHRKITFWKKIFSHWAI